ncbi:MAG: cobalamin-independent methionine synthase II family protein [Acidobacteriota bacterium]|nr:MAG: cobalamin-independent methionine synthase II family protein [Acidobacteriota bacterium]
MKREILTTVVGSYPVPSWLAGAETDSHALEDAITVVLAVQARAGIDVVTDGEVSRFDPSHPETNGMIEYFICQLSGVDTRLTRLEIEEFRSQAGFQFRKKPAGIVRDQIGEGTLYLRDDFERLAKIASLPLKFTITSPYMLAKTLLDVHYRSFEPMVLDLAEVLRKQVRDIPAEVLQIDEANLPGSPQDAALAARAINHILSGAEKCGHKAVHLCFGNYGGQTIQKGYWESLLPFFNSLECDHLILEFARRGSEEIEVFRNLRPEISLGVGVIDIKDNQVETPEQVARRIEAAIRKLGRTRVRWVHPDCGFWMLPRSVADGKMQSLVRGRDLFLGGEA